MTDEFPNPRCVLRQPRQYAPDMDKQGVLQFRHPWVVEIVNSKVGPGIVCRRSFAKLDPVRRGALLMVAQSLLASAPLHRQDAPPGTEPRLLEAYFLPLEELQNQQQFHLRVHADGSLSVQGIPTSQDSFISDPEQFGKYAARIKQLEDANASLLEENQRLRRTTADCSRILVEKDRLLNQHVNVTLEEALGAFQRDYRPGREQTKRNVEATIRKLVFGKTLADGRTVRGLGPRRQLTAVTPANLDRWLDEYPTTNPVTIIHLRAHLSVFWNTCRRHYDLGTTPFDGRRLKKRGDLLTLARKRMPPAIRKLEDLSLLLDALAPEPYWQSWVAFACLAGPRWGEQRALRVEDLDLEANPPRVIFRATTGHDLKTTGNAVPIERHVLLPVLKRFRETWTAPRRFVWPSLRRTRGRADKQATDQPWTHNSFTREFRKALSTACARSPHPSHEVWSYGPVEYRHTFGTLLALSGVNATEIARMMRNSTEVAAAHYIAFNLTDERLKGRLLWA